MKDIRADSDEKTTVLETLFAVPADKRDEGWKEAFLEAIADACLACRSTDAIEGADGFPYIHLHVSLPEKSLRKHTIRHLKDEILLDGGYGVAIFSGEDEPVWLFSYGDILSFHLYGSFAAGNLRFASASDGKSFEQGEDILVGQPSATILPPEARKALGAFLRRHYPDPGIVLICRNGMSTHELVLNCSRDKFDDEESYHSVMRGIGWFLPRGYVYRALTGEGRRFFDLL